MQLDVKTLYLLNIAVAFVTAGVSFLSWFHRVSISDRATS